MLLGKTVSQVLSSNVYVQFVCDDSIYTLTSDEPGLLIQDPIGSVTGEITGFGNTEDNLYTVTSGEGSILTFQANKILKLTKGDI